MDDKLTFVQPLCLAFLAAIPLLLLLKIVAGRSRESSIHRMVAANLRSRLVFGSRPALGWLVFITEIVGFTLIALAAAQPRYGYIEQETYTEGRNVIIAIDTSRSMLARDLEPDRLTRSKLAAQDLINALPGERIGLMAFAGSAYMQAPLTLDHAAVQESIDQLDIYSSRTGGTNLGECIRTALKTFKENQASQSAIVIFTDGDDLEGTALDAAQEAADKGVIIVPVGVGSAQGSIIPDTESNVADQFIRDESGQLVKSRLDINAMETIASITNGIFINLNSQTMNSAIVKSMLGRLEASATETKSKRVPFERYQWPLTAGLVLLVLGFISTLFRRNSSYAPAAVAIAIFTLLPVPDAAAAPVKTAEAIAAYREGNYEQSAKLFQEVIKNENPTPEMFYASGAANYKSENFDEALKAFTRSLTSDDSSLRENSHYNIGNTLFRRGEHRLQPKKSAEGKTTAPPVDEVIAEWENAIAHYDDTLSLNPDNTSATKNLDIVKKRIEQLKQQQEQQKKSEEKKDEDKKDGDKKDEEKKDQEKQENEQKQDQKDQEKKDGDEQKDEEGEKKDGDQKSEEKQEGTEGEKKDGDKKEGSGTEGEDEKKSEDGKPKEQPSDQKDAKDGDKENAQQKDGTEGDKKDDKEGDRQMSVPADEKKNPETGYSKKDARQLLQMLSDEQLDITPLRRRANRGFSKDW